MGKQFTDDEIDDLSVIRTRWEATPDILCVLEVTASVGGGGKGVSGNVLVRRGQIRKELALDLQEKAFVQAPDMRSFSVVMTDADQTTIEFVWEVGRPWREHTYSRPPANPDEFGSGIGDENQQP